MKKLIKILSASVVSVAFMGTVASAASCDGSIVITNTGAGSNNTVSCTDVTNIVLTCDNNVIVGSVNTQTGTSGNADSSDNTTAGNVATGQVVNNNGQDVTIGAGCETLAAQAGETPTPGKGGGGGSVVETPEVLPNTANQSTPLMAAMSLGIAAGVVALSRLIVAAYRRFSLR